MNEEIEKQLGNLKLEAAEKELEYWSLKVDVARMEKEVHEKMVKYLDNNLDKLMKIGFGVSDFNLREE